jgi:transmembrane sensor
LLIGAAANFFFLKDSKNNTPIANHDNQTPVNHDLQPGKDQAVFQLSDGTKIILNEACYGFVGKEGIADISKKDGELNYTITDPASIADQGMNTLRILPGDKWKPDLSDGSHVFFNAESSITYPVVHLVIHGK